ncbi:MAG TPA: NADH-quinone oxidoreductase subunit NuoG [Bacteroidales bacterium]|nr:NADH-quinone oxidoreductase subunit NuoG [Bacteroidales bacterium]
MVKIKINGNDYEVDPGKNLLHTCLGLGFDIPYFCYHPALGSVGACRQCAVKKHKDENDKAGRITMSCMEPVTDGLIITTDDADIRDFRRSIIEALMINHPHDCPVCDEGGECHLQDMTVLTGHNYRRFNFRKRTYLNQYLGPYLNHEMNRCIQCYRCVRYYRDYAGGKDLHVFGSASHIYFGRHKDGMLESIFSGNLAEVCPTGVFTDKTLSRHYTRKWDLTNAPSVCNNCSVGCNIIIGERYGMVRRIRSRYNSKVNGYFICDKGRFGYEYINAPERLKQLTIKTKSYAEPGGLPNDTINSALTAAIKSKRIAGIGSPLASLESNYALQTLVGKEDFYQGISALEHDYMREAVRLLKDPAFHTPSLNDIEKCDAVIVLGDDPAKTAPMLALAIRQATRNKSFEIAAGAKIPSWNDAAVRDIAHNVYSPLFLAITDHSQLEDVVSGTFIGKIEEIEKLGITIAGSIAKNKQKQKPGKEEDFASKAARALSDAVNPLIVAGSSGNYKGTLSAAEKISAALKAAGKKVSLSVIVPHCNSIGLALLGGKSFEDLSDRNDVETLIIIENDLYERSSVTEKILNKAKDIIYINHSANATADKAGIIMPAGTFAESTGTIVSFEGRAQRYYRVLPLTSELRDGWRWISKLLELDDRNRSWLDFSDIAQSFSEDYPFYAAIEKAMPGANLRYEGEKVARQTPRYSGRTAMNANITVHEPKPPEDYDSPLNFSMEGYKGITSSDLTPEYQAPGWNSPQAINKYLKEPGGEPYDSNEGYRIFD